MKDRAQKRALALVLVTAATFAVTAPAAAADNSDQPVVATVYAQGAAPVQDSTTIGALEGHCPAYSGSAIPQYSGGSTPSQSISQQAWTLASVLGCLPTQVAVASVTSLVVINEQGQPESGPNSVLSQADLNTPSDFSDPTASPLIFSDGSNIIYQRPQRSTSDTNATDEVTVSDPQAFAFQIFEGPRLSIAITPTPSTVSAGTGVSFGSTGVPANDQATYAWSFGGGATNSTQPAPTVTFATPGVYTITLTVTDNSSGSVGIATTTITVGDTTPTQTSTTPRTVGPTHGNQGGSIGAPAKTTTTPTRTQSSPPTPTRPKPKPKKPKPKPTLTTPSRTTPTRTTPTRTTPVHTPPAHTTPTPTRTTAATPANTQTTPGTGRAGGLHSGAGGATSTPARASSTTTAPATTAPATTAPATTAPATTTAPAATVTQPVRTTPGHRPRPSPTKPKPAHEHSAPTSQPTKPPGQRVSGQLLASLTPVPAGSSALVHTVRRPSAVSAAALSGAPGTSPWPAIAGIAAALLLLVLGAGRELSGRGGRRRRD